MRIILSILLALSVAEAQSVKQFIWKQDASGNATPYIDGKTVNYDSLHLYRKDSLYTKSQVYNKTESDARYTTPADTTAFRTASNQLYVPKVAGATSVLVYPDYGTGSGIGAAGTIGTDSKTVVHQHFLPIYKPTQIGRIGIYHTASGGTQDTLTVGIFSDTTTTSTTLLCFARIIMTTTGIFTAVTNTTITLQPGQYVIGYGYSRNSGSTMTAPVVSIDQTVDAMFNASSSVSRYFGQGTKTMTPGMVLPNNLGAPARVSPTWNFPRFIFYSN